MDKTIKENIIVKLTNDLLFIELVDLLKNNENRILKNIINDKFFNIITIIKKIDYNINNIKNLTDDDLMLINDLIKDKTNVVTIILEIKKKREEIYKYVNTIFIIQQLILVVVILIYIYLIYDLYFVNKTETNINFYLYYLNVLSNVLLFTYIISLKNTIFVIYNNIIAIKNFLVNTFTELPLFVYIIIFKTILLFILNNHEIIMKATNDYGRIIIIAIVIMIIAVVLYNIYTNFMKTDNPIADIDLSVYIFDKYGPNLVNNVNNFIDNKSNIKPVT
jgi:hypothetical protein